MSCPILVYSDLLFSSLQACDLFYMHPVECLVCVVLPFLVTPRVLPLHWLMWEGFLVKGVQ